MAQLNANTEDCWLFAGFLDKKGYGLICYWIPGKGNTSIGAHKAMFENTNGWVPTPLVMNHLCEIPQCINPKHLEAITNKDNILRGRGVTAQNARKTHCIRGHKLKGVNLDTRYGSRRCFACRRLQGSILAVN